MDLITHKNQVTSAVHYNKMQEERKGKELNLFKCVAVLALEH